MANAAPLAACRPQGAGADPLDQIIDATLGNRSSGGISRSSLCRTACSSRLFSISPGTMAGPRSPPATGPVRKSTRKSPDCLSSPWHFDVRDEQRTDVGLEELRLAAGGRGCQIHGGRFVPRAQPEREQKQNRQRGQIVAACKLVRRVVVRQTAPRCKPAALHRLVTAGGNEISLPGEPHGCTRFSVTPAT